MKIVCKKNDIMNGVNIALRAVPNKTTMPILECIIIRANSNNIKFITNDMQIAIETIVEGNVIEEGSIAVEARLFSEIIRKLPDNDVKIETNSYYMTTITCEKAEFSINCRSDEEFPDIPSIEKKEALVVPQFSLKEMITQTVFAISDNQGQPAMTGELFEINGDEFRIVALDGHRVALRKIRLNDEYKYTKVIIPGKTLNEISKILSGDMDDDVAIYFTKNHVLFDLQNTIVVSRLIEGEYFKINQMFTSGYETKVTVNRRDLIDCIDRSTLFIKDADKKPIVIDVKDYNLNMKVNSQIGAMCEDIEIQKEGKDIIIGLSSRYMLEILRVIDDETITIFMNNTKSPCYIKNEEESYNYLVLPINFR